jgi:transcriptional regulator with XRE-family HTH domain
MARGASVPDPIDLHVGRRLRIRRRHLGLSQQGLGDQLGVTFQQIQKYERAGNRVSCSVLFELARALGVTPGYFFEGLAGPTELGDGPDLVESLLLEPNGLRLARAFLRIPAVELRRDLANLIEAIAETTFAELTEARTAC